MRASSGIQGKTGKSMFDTMFANAERERNRIRSLDGLRALAIILVLMFHTLLTIYTHARKGATITIFASDRVTWFVMNCWTGVNLFFVLSGFLIAMQLAGIFCQSPTLQGGLLRSYARKRFCRIAPAYYAVAIPSLMTLHGLHGIPEQEWPLVLMSYLFFMQDYFFQTLLAQYWSLAVEMKFYALAPALVLFLEKLTLNTRHAVIALMIAALVMLRIAVAWMAPPVTSDIQFSMMFRNPFHMSIDSLMIGVAAFFLWNDARIRHLLNAPLVSNALFTAGTLLFITLGAFTMPHYVHFPQPVTFFTETLFVTLVSLAFAAMLLGLLGPCYFAPLFSSWPMRIVAELSYSIYLVHLLFVKRALIFAHENVPDPLNMTTVWCSTFVCLLIYAVPVAAVVYIFIERPVNRWAHRSL
jgi:peptidoglycan/LPS O-acetylase OafA/YrhL